jgi:hypothetical protein
MSRGQSGESVHVFRNSPGKLTLIADHAIFIHRRNCENFDGHSADLFNSAELEKAD